MTKIYCDDKSGRAYWIEDNCFMSAPLIGKYGGFNVDERSYISDWENMEPFWENSENFKNLILILEKLLEKN